MVWAKNDACKAHILCYTVQVTTYSFIPINLTFMGRSIIFCFLLKGMIVQNTTKKIGRKKKLVITSDV